jgi:hypothetical protein
VAALLAVVLGVATLGYALVQIVGQISEQRATPSTTPAFTPPTETTIRELDPVPVPTTVESPTPTFTADPGATVGISDDTGRLSVHVPEAWADVATGAWVSRDEPIGIRINASLDRAAWFEGWGTPGAFIGVTSERSTGELFGSFNDSCTYASRFPVPIGATSGEADLWVLCGEEQSELIVAVAEVDPAGALMLIQVVIVDGDWAGFTSILQSVSYEP